MPREEIPDLIAPYGNNAIPTFKAVVSFETALKILPLTSEIAEQKPQWSKTPRHALNRHRRRRRQQLRSGSSECWAAHSADRMWRLHE